jgi:phospholipid/cholesterol/gamma-HCH transport system substrate-binding protein
VERRAQFLLVAVFLLLSVGSVVWFMRWISPAEGDAFEQRLVQFDGSVSGLSVGGEVRYLGVPVGRVLDIGLNPQRTGRVDVQIGLDQPLPDSADLVALLEPQGITGLAVIGLSDRDTTSAPVDVAPGVIPGQPSVFSAVSASALQLAKQAEIALTRFNALLSVETIENFEVTARELRSLAGNLSRASGDVDALVASLGRVSTQVESALPAYHSLALRLEDDLFPTIIDAGQSLQATSDTLAATVGENREQVKQMLQQDLPSLIRVGDELAITLQELQRLARNINNQPGALLYGAPVKEADIPLE